MAARASGPVLRDHAEDALGLRLEIGVRHHLADDPHHRRLVGVDLVGGEEQVAGPGQPDGVDQAGRHERVGDARVAARVRGSGPASDAIATSQCRTRSMPPATHSPLILATHSFEQRSMWRNGKWSVGSHSVAQGLEVFSVTGHVTAGTEPLVGAGQADRVQLGLGRRPRSPRASARGTCPGCRSCAAPGRLTRRCSTRPRTSVTRKREPRSGAATLRFGHDPPSWYSLLGGAVQHLLVHDLLRHPAEDALGELARPLGRRLRPRVLAGRVRVVGLEQDVVRVLGDRVAGGLLLEPEAAVHLALEVLAGQQVVLGVLERVRRRPSTASRTSPEPRAASPTPDSTETKLRSGNRWQTPPKIRSVTQRMLSMKISDETLAKLVIQPMPAVSTNWVPIEPPPTWKFTGETGLLRRGPDRVPVGVRRAAASRSPAAGCRS